MWQLKVTPGTVPSVTSVRWSCHRREVQCVHAERAVREPNTSCSNIYVGTEKHHVGISIFRHLPGPVYLTWRRNMIPKACTFWSIGVGCTAIHSWMLHQVGGIISRNRTHAANNRITWLWKWSPRQIHMNYSHCEFHAAVRLRNLIYRIYLRKGLGGIHYFTSTIPWIQSRAFCGLLEA